MLLIWQTQIPRYILGILVISFLALWDFFNGNFHSEGCHQSMLFFSTSISIAESQSCLLEEA